MRCERVAGCEVAESHLAKFGCRRVRLSGVAPCDLFLIILRDSSTDAKVDANITRARGHYNKSEVPRGGIRGVRPQGEIRFAVVLPRRADATRLRSHIDVIKWQ